GFGFRLKDGRKGAPSRGRTGLRRGLVLVTGLHAMPGQPVVVEGASDVAALLDLNIPAIGRPFNSGGAEILALCEWLQPRALLVVGEREQKAGGRWPGRDGAVSVATTLARKWRCAMLWTLPPEGCKDVRAWLNATSADRTSLRDGEAGAKELARSE